jgi:predicted O-methyltransferase YrrM
MTICNNEILTRLNVHPKYPKWLPTQLRRGWKLSQNINKVFHTSLDDSQIQALFSLDGHITHRQCAVLFYFAYTLPGRERIVEIGSFKGKSTACMATALKLKNIDDRIVAIDPHINTGDNLIVPVYEEESSFEAFTKNISNLGLTDKVRPIKKTSEDAIVGWDQPIKLLFIDGSHKYEDVLLDLTLWEPWVKTGGIIVMHDTKPKKYNEGVTRAMNEHIVNSGRFRESLRLLNMTVFEKKSN